MLRLWGASSAIAVVLVIGALTTSAAADTPLETARAAVESSDYLTARSSLAAALASGANSPDEMVEIYRLTGIVAGALGDAQAASDAFRRGLALTPKITLPVGTSPKITRPFATAQTYYRSHEPLKIKTETTATPPSLTVVVASDPFGMVAKAQVTVVVDGGAEQELEATGTERISIALPAGARLDLRVAALDNKGNRLVELGSKEVPIVIVGAGGATATKVAKHVPPPPVPRAPAHARPTYLQWWLWGGATVVFGGAATYFGMSAISAKNDLDHLNMTSQNHTFDEAKDLEQAARTHVLLTNIGIGVAAACGVTAGILYLTRPRVVTERRITTLAPVPIQGGGAVVLGGQF
jgi:hypothetical protein